MINNISNTIKRVAAILLSLLILLSSCPFMSILGSVYAESSATEISTVEELAAISDNLNGNYKLTKDLDFSELTWTSIGTSSAPFTGTFDGDGHTIKGLTVNVSTTGDAYAGLFGYIKYVNTNSVVKNVIIEDCNITGSTSNGNSYAGAIAGYSENGMISGCGFTGKVFAKSTTGGYRYAGGIVGFMTGGETDKCYANGSVEADDYVGGIVGSKSYGTVSNCYNLKGLSSNYAGGIAGQASQGNINSCYSLGTYTSNYGTGFAGGIVGLNSNCTVSNSYYESNTTSGGGTKCTRANLMKQDTFSGFDFTDTWTIDTEDGFLFPRLKAVKMTYSNEITSISIKTTPSVIEYALNKGTLDTSDGVITVSYSDGSSVDVDITESMVSGFDNSKLGEQTMTITYKGKTTTYNITVVDRTVKAIEMENLPTKTIYTKGLDAELDIDGGTIKVTYNDGTTESIPLTENMVSGFDISTTGKKTIAVEYEEQMTSFEIEVVKESKIEGELHRNIVLEQTDNNCIKFGSYPQTEIVSTADQCGTVARTWSSSNDYIVDKTLYSKLSNANWDQKGDTVIEGEKYHRIRKSDATYYGSSNGYYWSDWSTYHYFKYEPIKWRILESAEKEIFVFSEIALDNQSYNQQYRGITWEICTLRSWLNSYGSSYNVHSKDYSNNGFYNIAFTDSEKAVIETTVVDNSDENSYGVTGGKNTEDKVFLLSENELSGITDILRQTKSSTYAKAKGVYADNDSEYLGNCNWYLRSPGCDTHNVEYVTYNGGKNVLGTGVSSNGYVPRNSSDSHADHYGIVPALRIKLQSNNPITIGEPVNEIIISSADETIYTGEEVEPTVKIDGLTENLDYTVSYADNTDVGTATITITGIGDYSGTLTKTFTIKNDITPYSFSLDTTTYTYDGTAKKPAVVVDGLEKNKDYMVTYSSNINAGTAKATIEGIGSYTGTVELEYTINPQSIEDRTLQIAENSYTYDGTAKEPQATIEDLVQGTDYEVTYSDNVNAGTAKVTVTGIGNYTGTLETSFKIDTQSINDKEIVLDSEYCIYDGTAKKPAVTISGLTEGTDFVVSYKNNTEVGTATAYAAGIGNYQGKTSKTFAIRIDVAGESFALEKESVTYDGTAQEPGIVTEYVLDTDYTVAYSNNTNAGTATATITGIGRCVGTKVLEFTIERQSIEGKTASLSEKSYVYDGTAKTPTVSINNLVKGTDFSVAYENNTAAGTAKVTITGIGNYTGTIEKEYTIERCDISDMNVQLNETAYVYDGTEKTPTVTIEGLTQDTDYTVEYKDNTEIGKATATVTGIGNYKGGKDESFKIGNDITACDITLSEYSYVYDGKEKRPTVTINGLEEGKDFTVGYSDNINAGAATVNIFSMGDYVGNTSVAYTIEKYRYAKESSVSGSISGYYVALEQPDNKHVYFGSYPQTEIVSTASQCGTYGKDWESSSDYTVDATLYAALQNASWDSNGDTTVEGNKYHRIQKSNATYSVSSDYYAMYSWSDSTTYHYFKYEPIKWRILKLLDDDAFLLSEGALDDQQYNTSRTSITWENSTVRSWLNSSFYNMAFSNDEKSAIKRTTVVNANNKYYETSGGNNTEDKVFLLSEDEVYGSNATEYGFGSSNDSNTARMMKSSTYAKAMGTWASVNSSYLGNCYWCLRSPGSDTLYAAEVNFDGSVKSSGRYVNSNIGILPALHINLKSNNPITAYETITDIRLSTETAIYTGAEIKPNVTIDGLTENEDYTVSYANNTEVGTATVTVNGIGEFSGALTKTFEIIEKNTIELDSEKYTYDGSAKEPNVAIDGLTEGTDYDVTYRNNTDAGTAIAVVTLKGNYAGELTKDFTINAYDLSDMTAKLSQEQYIYSGDANEPAVTIDGLDEGVDFEVAYTDNVEAGQATATITGIGNYSGTIVKNFKIGYMIVDDLVLSETEVLYDGTAKEPAVTWGDLVLGEDFEVEYSNNTKIGTAKVTATGIGKYIGTETLTFEIVSPNINNYEVTFNPGHLVYLGAALTPDIAIEGLTKDTDYTVEYKNNNAAGEASVVLTGINNYNGTITKTFEIHSLTKTAARTAKCTETGNTAYWTCSCGKYFSDSEGETEIEEDSWIISAKGHSLTKTEAVSPTCTEAGSSAYWTCSECSKYFNDSEGKTEISENSWILKATGHDMTKTAQVKATFKKSGNTDYWYCSDCEKYFGDANGDTQIAENSWIVAQIDVNSIKLGKTEYTYDGNAKEPAVTVKDINGSTLTSGTDYTVSYSNNVNAGMATAKIIFTGNYSGSIEKNYEIKKATPSYEAPTGLTATYGDKLSSVALPDGFTWVDGTQTVGNAGTNPFKAIYTPADTDNYKIVKGIDVQVEVAKATVKAGAIDTLEAICKETLSQIALPDGYVWNDGTQSVGTASSNVKYFKATFKATDTANYLDNTDVTVGIRVKHGDSKTEITKVASTTEAGTIRTYCEACNATLEEKTIPQIAIHELAKTSVKYDGSEQKPAVTIKDSEGNALAEGKDYNVVYANNVNVGTASVTITYKGRYTGEEKLNFAISSVKNVEAALSKTAYIYDGTAHTPGATVTSSIGTLVQGTDYDIAYSGNVNAGTAKAVITLKGNYFGTIEKTFEIEQADKSKVTASVASTATYCGSAIEPVVTVCGVNETVLTEGTDYELKYTDNTNVGTAKATITLKGNYFGEITKEFEITQADGTKLACELSDAEYVYDGKSKTPTPIITGLDGKSLTKGADYTVEYSNNKNAGTAKATITFKGNYNGTTTENFEIKALKVDAELLKTSYKYRGVAIEPEVSLLTSNGLKPQEGTDYDVEYTDNNAPGTGHATITFKGNYTGSVTKDFEIVTTNSVALKSAMSDTPLTLTWKDPNNNETVLNTGEHTFANLADGTYTLVASAGGDYVDREYTFDADGNITQDIELFKLGDANCDGELSAEDVTRIARHIAKISIEDDAYTLKLFDTDKSGKDADATDVTHLARYIAKIISAL